ncbi:PEP-CTERM sorting domain-containing protein [Luteolibacter sp. GHJ8]|uniref:PEP-CTERM sorting domain-containing protein n=1 Tax=Luteolibacter rhizosphaerae TaxID=2989719 RepID=A0ABT3G7Z6_9BACT|nr:PEP-CTERM sorting domain-containing protein [Luteolibacter rhizosphaerae]MCW1915616.1 PEP-CTERM sorting domain-containing protein [Luteolibacter rhizosphaerae]
MKTLALATSLLASLTVLAEAVVLQLDFGSSTSPVATGTTAATGNFLSNTPTASVSNIEGTGITFSIENVGVFSFDNATEPLTTDGFYTFGNNENSHNFTLSGLAPGSIVTLYAVAAWDGNPRGAQVTFGGTTAQAQVVGTPGTTPTLANYTLIGTAVANGSGVVSGFIAGAHLDDPTCEGQVGAFAFNLVPEPSSSLLGLIGLGALILRRKR